MYKVLWIKLTVVEVDVHGRYGNNSPGTIFNTATLPCIFCLQPPAVHTLAAHGKSTHIVGNLKIANEERALESMHGATSATEPGD